MGKGPDRTLRLLFPQWQGGGQPVYHLGSRLLDWLAPAHGGPTETVEVPAPGPDALEIEAGILSRSAVLAQADAATRILDRHAPDRIVVLGGDCGVDLAPFAWLSARHSDDLALLWIDAHPDLMTTGETANSHAMVLRHLLGEGDPDFAARVPVPLRPDRVMIAGLGRLSHVEQATVDRLGITCLDGDALAAGAGPVIDWLRRTGVRHLAIHLDLDVADPALFRSLWVTEPGRPPGTFDAIPQGRLDFLQVAALVSEVAAETTVVGLGITEYLPWDAAALQALLHRLPLLGAGGSGDHSPGASR
jgi:arginase